MIRTRIVSSEKCPQCKFYIKVLTKSNFEFEVYDADIKANQPQLDAWQITEMPVVQLVEGDKSVVLYQFQPGQISPRAINFMAKKVAKEQQKKLDQQEKIRQMTEAATKGDKE